MRVCFAPFSTTGTATVVPSSSKSPPSISLFYARVCLLRAYFRVLFLQPNGLHVSQRRLPPTPSLEISQPKNTLLFLLILSLCGYWLLIVKSDDGFISYGLCFSGVVLCWCWCWNFKWMMRVGFYCMIGRMEIKKWRKALSNFFYQQCWIPKISGLWRAWLHL